MEDILAPRYIDPVAALKHLEALRSAFTPTHCAAHWSRTSIAHDA